MLDPDPPTACQAAELGTAGRGLSEHSSDVTACQDLHFARFKPAAAATLMAAPTARWRAVSALRGRARPRRGSCRVPVWPLTARAAAATVAAVPTHGWVPIIVTLAGGASAAGMGALGAAATARALLGAFGQYVERVPAR